MGRNLSDHSESPIRGRGSPRRRSPSRRRSPAPHRSSHTASLAVREKPYSRNVSPKRAKSRSPVSRSPVRVKPSTHSRSHKHAKSRSPVPALPVKEKSSRHTRSPKNIKSISPVTRSPSPRTKRLKRAQAESESEKVSERNHGRGEDRARHRERDLDREPSERRSGRDAVHNGSSRSRHERSASPTDRHHRSRHRSRSPPATDTRARDEVTNSRVGERRNGDNDSVAKMAATEEALETKEKQKPSFELSGKLAAETNRVKGITLLFTEPPEARKPDTRWRLYVFKGGEVLNDPLYVHRQTCYLFGRERRVADIPTDHPSCSKQHAVLQYRQVDNEKPDGTISKQPRVCVTAREFGWMMIINWLPRFDSLNCRSVGDIGTTYLEDLTLCLLGGIGRILCNPRMKHVEVPILQHSETISVFCKVRYIFLAYNYLLDFNVVGVGIQSIYLVTLVCSQILLPHFSTFT